MSQDNYRDQEERLKLLFSRQAKHSSQMWRKEAQAKAERAFELLRLNMDQEAFHMALEASSIDTGNLEALEIIAWIYYRHQDRDKALEYLEKGVKLLSLPEYDFRIDYRLHLIVLATAMADQPQLEKEVQKLTSALLDNLYILVHDDAVFYAGETAASGGILEQMAALRVGEISARVLWRVNMGQSSLGLFNALIYELNKMRNQVPYPAQAIKLTAKILQQEWEEWSKTKLLQEQSESVKRQSQFDIDSAWGWFIFLGFCIACVLSFMWRPQTTFNIRMIDIGIQTLTHGGVGCYLYYRWRKKVRTQNWTDQQAQILENIKALGQ